MKYQSDIDKRALCLNCGNYQFWGPTASQMKRHRYNCKRSKKLNKLKEAAISIINQLNDYAK